MEAKVKKIDYCVRVKTNDGKIGDTYLKQLRYVRAANQIIENVIKGEFPVFKKSKQSKPLKRSD